MQKKAVCWDVGDVILEYRVDTSLENLASIFNTSPFGISAFFDTELVDEYWRMTFLEAIETFPFWIPEKIYDAFCQQFQKQPDYDYFIDAFSRPLRSDPEHKDRFLGFSERIQRKGHIQSIISNTNSIHSFKMDYGLGYYFKHIPSYLRYYSWERKLRKSEEPHLFNRVFDDIEEFFKIKRSDIFFVDDKQENIIGAEKAGAKGFLFCISNGIYRLEERLVKAGLEL